MINTMEIFDSEAAIKQAGGDAQLADELFGMLLSELPDYQQKVDMQCKQADYDKLLDTVHKLNGATRYTGVPALSVAANQFEQALRRDGTTNYHELCNNLISEIQRLKDAYPKK
jgi:two-component system sensor histidine kinase BarA